jgi:ribosomal protein L33
MNTSFQPQTNEQTKRVNLVIQQFLKNYVAINQQNWVDHLELAKFCYNNLKHSIIGAMPFQMVTNRAYNLGYKWATLE